ncbi:DUF58 domain-containing protein [Paeniglutamicibacter psychrophenolicus]|uniref:Uncharacterized protein (DUF58 family) n=1 Tax=Paeniglutamicibacter psychrophenolicus TaxID=257454 RepID=A0ABS4WI42_9MICC|nr:DUF58 domain-containing protein [Paeniglutamicibacter psychrophenolicus]MBP2375882.1 uncharacterized protein (DUF58 family) [Paeniglutamicibacter psychrophenolicus]
MSRGSTRAGNRASTRAATRAATRATARALKATADKSAGMLADAAALLREALHPLLVRCRTLFATYLAPAGRVVSPLGFVVAGTAGLLWLLGVAFGWQEALLGAFMASLLLLVALGFIIGRSDFRINLELNRTRVAVGDRAVGFMEVANPTGRTSFATLMELSVGAAVATFRVPRLAPGAEHEDLFTIPTRRRAVLTVGPVRSVRQDPFGLLRRQVRFTGSYELFVHPRTTALHGSSAGFIRDLEGMTTRDLSNSDVSFHALRGYVAGDDRRHIHWKSSARTGELMVRQFEETRRSHLAIALSANLGEYGDPATAPDDFELAVSAAASIGLQAVTDQRKLSVLAQTGPVRTDTGRNMLDSLTRLQARTLPRHDVASLVRGTIEAVPGASVVFILTGAGTTARQLREASMHVPFGVRAIAIRAGHGLRAARSDIGELTVLTLGSLDELGLLLRRAAA